MIFYHFSRHRHHLLGLVSVLLALLALWSGAGHGVSFLFGGSSQRLFLVALGGLGFIAAVFYITDPFGMYEIKRFGRVCKWVAVISVLVTITGIFNVKELLVKAIGINGIGAIVFLIVVSYGLYVMIVKGLFRNIFGKNEQ